MATLYRTLQLLLFVSPLLHSHFSSHASSPAPSITLPRIKFMTGLGSENADDYKDDYIDSQSSPPEVVASVRTPLTHSEPKLCEYDSCLEDQEPCSSLAAKTGCLCPGVSRPNVPPHPPRIHALRPVREGEHRGKVEVQWCAPSSVVSWYKVVVEGSDANPLQFGEALRRGMVGSLEVGTKVCVEAVNSAGHSEQTKFSCQRYDPPVTSDHKMLFGVIGGGIVLLLLVVVGAVILLKYKVCKKAKHDSANGLGNPSYSREGPL